MRVLIQPKMEAMFILPGISVLLRVFCPSCILPENKREKARPSSLCGCPRTQPGHKNPAAGYIQSTASRLAAEGCHSQQETLLVKPRVSRPLRTFPCLLQRPFPFADLQIALPSIIHNIHKQARPLLRESILRKERAHLDDVPNLG